MQADGPRCVIGVRNFGPQQSEALVSEAEDAVGHGVKEKVSLQANRCLMAQAWAWTKGPSGRSKCLVAELFSPPCFSWLQSSMERRVWLLTFCRVGI